MSSSRESILGNIRAAVGRSSRAQHVDIDAHLNARPRGPVPTGNWPQSREATIARFIERAKSLASTVDRVASLQEVPAAAARYLSEGKLPRQAVCWPELSALGWSAAGLTVEARAANGTDLVGITSCFCSIADTGTLMLLSGTETAAVTSLLVETHIAIVPLSRLQAFMEDGWALLRQERGEPPRAVNFVSGPSRTTDIEQTLTFGVHGPYRVHLILVDA